jgi:hypothetical protein
MGVFRILFDRLGTRATNAAMTSRFTAAIGDADAKPLIGAGCALKTAGQSCRAGSTRARSVGRDQVVVAPRSNTRTTSSERDFVSVLRKMLFTWSPTVLSLMNRLPAMRPLL